MDLVKDKPTTMNALLASASIALLALSVGCSTKTEATPDALPAQTQHKTTTVPATPPSKAEFENWKSMISKVPKPEHPCLMASYPETQWREIRCIKPPNYPYLPAHGTRPTTVGNGTDWSAAVTGHQYFAEGSFHHVTGVKSENQKGQQNEYSLQLNTQPFNSYECKALGSPDPSDCREWQQFIYATDGSDAAVFIQYWLINFGPGGTSCPSGWNSSGTAEISCFINSNGGDVPAEPATNLGNLILSGTAGMGSHHDFLDFEVYGYNEYFINGDNWFPDLKNKWQESEFNVFGNCCGNEAIFNAGSTAVVRLEVGRGINTIAPTCDQQGFTGETNNLFLTGESSSWPKVTYPSIVFTETNATHSQPSCVAKGPS